MTRPAVRGPIDGVAVHQDVAVTLTYNDTPPSLNRVGSRGSHWAWTREKKRWQQVWEVELMLSKLPKGLAHVEASISLRFPDRRRRDADNHTAVCLKALADSLVPLYIEDDTPEYFTFAGLSFEVERGPRRTTVVLTGTNPREEVAP